MFPFFFRARFQTKILFGIAGIVATIALILAPLVAHMTSRALVAESKKRGEALAQSLAVRALEPLLAQDLLRLKNMVDGARQADEDVVYAFVLDRNGFVLAHTFQKGFPVELLEVNKAELGEIQTPTSLLLDTDQGLIDDFAAPVLITDAQYGMVRIGISRSAILAEVDRLLLAMAGLLAGALVLAVFLATVFARRVTVRLALLRQQAEEMVKGNLDTHTGPVLKRNCWEIMNCDLKQCPAYGDSRRRCWYLAGTLCPECSGDEFPRKLSSCRNCQVYRENVGDEIQDLAETFDVMALTLKAHIDELREAERVLAGQQRLMRTILDVTPDLVSLVDTRIVYQAANKAFADFVGRPSENIVGNTDFDLFEEKTAEARNLESRDILLTGSRLDKEVQVESGGKPRWYHVVSIPVHDSDGRTAGLLRTERDITDLKVYQEQLIQAQKMESLGKLAGGVAHEINTPLGIILGYAQLLMEDVEEGSQIHEDLATIVRQAKVTRQIVADLLGFSRRTESSKREMCFNNSVMEAISLVTHTFALDKVEIVTQLDDRFPIIFGDPEKLKQVWINLLNNARDAMPEGGTIKVKTVLDTPGQKVSLMVADNGQGIDEAHLSQIFDPFFTTKPVGKGTGLGLSVSFGIVEDHGGDIRAESPVPEGVLPKTAKGKGPGTLFVVDLPLDHNSEYVLGERDDAHATGNDSKPQGEATNG